MSIRRFFLFLLIIACAVAAGFLLGQQTRVFVNAQKKPLAVNAEKKAPNGALELLKGFEKEKIRDFAILDLDEEKFYAVVRTSGTLSAGDTLTIYDEAGKIVYEHADSAVGALRVERFLKPDAHELTFATNGGGTDWALKVLSYKNGKFVEIVDAADTQFRGGFFTLPQYRTGNPTPYFKPSQLILIQQQGGADESPKASIFRTKNDKFQKVGEINMQEFGDFLELRIKN